MPPAPIIAVKGTQMASERVSKALTGDIYTRRWQTTKTKGKGKKKQTTVVDHELKANPVSIGLGLVAVGVAATGAAVGLWFAQRKLVHVVPEGGAKMWRLVRLYDPTTKTVVDVPAVPAKAEVSHWEVQTRYIEKPGGIIVPVTDKFLVIDQYAQPAIPAVTHVESLGSRTVVQTLRGVPLRTYIGGSSLSDAQMLSERERAVGWSLDTVEAQERKSDRTGDYMLSRVRFTNAVKAKYGTASRPGFGSGDITGLGNVGSALGFIFDPLGLLK